MKLFFSPNSWMYKFLGKIVDLFFLNLLFLLTSLPILTIGPSCIALFEVTRKMVLEEDTSNFQTYFMSFKKNFKRGLVLSIIMILTLLLFNYLLNLLSFLTGFSFVLGLLGCSLFGLIWVIMWLYAFPYVVRYEDSISHTLFVSVQVALLNIKKTFLLLSVLVAVALLMGMGNTLFAFVSLLILALGFSSYALLTSEIVFPIFQKYEKQN